MLKQVYRFLSVLLVSNLIFTQIVLGKTQQNSENFDVSNPGEGQETDNDNPYIKYPDLEKMPPYYNDPGKYTTLYGVQDINDTYNSYFQPHKMPDKQEPR